MLKWRATTIPAGRSHKPASEALSWLPRPILRPTAWRYYVYNLPFAHHDYTKLGIY